MAASAHVLLLLVLAPAAVAAVVVRHDSADAGPGQAKSLAALAEHGRVFPTLKPKSDKTFFKRDYPDDLRPMPHPDFNFNHPYPIVQESSSYDKDYVKDENNDNGEWKAQFDFDILRNKLSKQTDEVKVALKKEQEEEKELDEVKRKESEAAEEAKKAEKTAEEAQKRAKEAEEKVNKIAGTGSGGDNETEVGGELGQAAKEVKKEMKDLEECQKQLEEARAKLKKLMMEKEAREKTIAQDKAKAVSKKVEATEAAKQANAKAEAALGNESSEDLRRKIKEEEAEYQEAMESYKMSEKEVKQTEDDLKAATERLRRFRKKVDPDGGVYRTEKSGTAALVPSVHALILSVLAVAGSIGVLL